ncbi:MAG TPA: aminopeptidase P N-terminal domain-containing protein [Gemmatimonadaceae bacterium]|nr:aminopeptidase P N-terminal domain-containing protein [Gemmatimonadaceae bacterium]
MICVARQVRASVAIAAISLIPQIAVSQTSLPSLAPPLGITAADYAARRAAVTAKVDSGVVLVFGETEPLDYYPTFFQMPNFEYLTGFDESDAVMLMVKRPRAATSTMMFVPRFPAIMERFVGEHTHPENMQSAIGMTGRLLAALRPVVDSLTATGLPLYFVPAVHTGDYFDADTLTFGARFINTLRAAHPRLVIRSLDSAITDLREKKTPVEIDLLRHAAQISVRAHREAMKAAAPGCGENEIQALIDGTFRRFGADRPGYGSIVASGKHANTLHYMIDNDTLRDGDLILIDAAASYRHYSADVTRTFPVNGKFTPAQREIYQLVRDAQEAYVRQIKNGVSMTIADDSGKAVIGRGLTRMGLIDSTEAAFDGLQCPPDGCKQISLYALHGYGGHGIGLEVHDPAQYYDPGNLFKSGDVFTVEPGVYVAPDYIALMPDTPRNRAMRSRIGPAVEKYKWIGVRIEDDYAVTDNGVEWLSRGAPREIDEIEALMREPSPQLPGGGTCGRQ